MADEIITIEPGLDVPSSVSDSLVDLNSKFSKLAQVLYGNLSLDSLRSQVIRTRFTDSTVAQINHRLEREPKAVIQLSGRLAYYTIVKINQRSIKIVPYLASAYSLKDGQRFQDKIKVTKGSIFRVGDSVRIDGETIAQITSINGNYLTLDKKVYYSGIADITLLTEYAQFLIL